MASPDQIPMVVVLWLEDLATEFDTLPLSSF